MWKYVKTGVNNNKEGHLVYSTGVFSCPLGGFESCTGVYPVSSTLRAIMQGCNAHVDHTQLSAVVNPPGVWYAWRWLAVDEDAKDDGLGIQDIAV